MKKCTILFFPLLLLCFCLLGIFVQKDKDKLVFYFQNDVGDSSIIKNLKYEFMTVQGNMKWEVKGKGDHIAVTYAPEKNIEDSTYGSIYAGMKTMETDASIKDIPAMCNDNESEEDIGCYFTKETKQLKLKFHAQASLRANGYESLALLDTDKSNITIQKRDGKPFEVLYMKEGENDYTITQIGKVQDTSLFSNSAIGEVLQSGTTPHYFYMSEDLLHLDLSKGDFICKDDVGGIYQVDEKDKITRLVPMQFGEEDIYNLLVQEDQLACLVRRHDRNYIVIYDKNGKKLRENEIKDIAIAEQFKQMEDGNFLLAALNTNGAEIVQIYDAQLKLIDEIHLLQELNNEECTYKDGILYTMNRQGDTGIKIGAYEADNVIYEGYLILRYNTVQNYNLLFEGYMQEAQEALYYNLNSPWFTNLNLQAEN